MVYSNKAFIALPHHVLGARLIRPGSHPSSPATAVVFIPAKKNIFVGAIKMIVYLLIRIWHFSSQNSKGSLLTCSVVAMLKEVTLKFTVSGNLLHR
jgi:hypothetical protein